MAAAANAGMMQSTPAAVKVRGVPIGVRGLPEVWRVSMPVLASTFGPNVRPAHTPTGLTILVNRINLSKQE